MNNEPTVGSMIRFSWGKSREILFPFNFKRWFKFLIILWLAGVGIQGFSANFKVPIKPSATPSKITISKPPAPLPPSGIKLSQTLGTPAAAEEVLRTGSKPGEKAPDPSRFSKLRAAVDRTANKMHPALAGMILGGLAFLGVGILVFFLWLSCRFNFVLLNALVTRDPSISEPFRQNKEPGNSYFKWSLVFLGLGLAVFLTLLGGSVGLLFLTKGNLVLSILLGFFAGFPVLIVLLGMIFIGILMRDFVLPVMYHEKIPAMKALMKFLKTNTFSIGKALQYLLILFGFWILAVILQAVIGLLVALGGLIAGGIVAIPGIFLIKALPLLKIPLIVFGILAAVALILAIIIVIGMVMLPVVIFFRVFALAYLTRLYPGCDLLHLQANR